MSLQTAIGRSNTRTMISPSHNITTVPTKSDREPQSKSFTGCWTCRHRHVKCDERHPICLRCESANIQCKGYALQLSWVDEGPHPKRLVRRITPVQRHWQPINAEEVQNILSDLAAKDGEGQAGLFTVFSANPLPAPSCNPAQSPDNVDIRISGQPSSYVDNTLDGMDNVAMTRAETWVFDESSFSVDTSSINFEQGSEVCRFETELADDSTNQDSRVTFDAEDRNNEEDSTDSGILQLNQGHSKSFPSHLDVLPRPSSQQKLLHHWVTHLSSAIQPTASTDDRLASVCLSLAYEGINTASNVSTGRLALFHAICSMSAFNLGALHGQDPSLIELGIRHQQLSQIHLRLNILSNDPKEIIAVLSTITLFIVDSAINGTSDSWREHIRGGEKVLKNNQEFWSHSSSASIIFQFFQVLKLVAKLQMSRDVEDLDLEVHSCDTSHFSDAIGISPALLHLLNVNKYLFSDSQLSELDLDRIEIQLLLARVLPDEGATSAHSQMRIHHESIFYYAFLIHFKRYVRGASIEEIEDLVEKGAECILRLDDVACKNPVVAITWPIIVIASHIREPIMRQRLRHWFASRRRYAFAAYEIAEKLLEEVWESHANAQDGSMKDWQDVFYALPNHDLLLI